MGDVQQLSDLDLAALVASKVCHDAIGPMTPIGFGLDMLEEEDEEERETALAMIRNGVGSITHTLQFARLAFGAAGFAGSQIDLDETKNVACNYIEGDKKHRIEWKSSLAFLPKNHVKLILNLVSIAKSTIPRGGVISVTIEGEDEKPVIAMRMVGEKARVPGGLLDLINTIPAQDMDARSIQPYFTGRVAKAIGAKISIEMDGADVSINVSFS